MSDESELVAELRALGGREAAERDEFTLARDDVRIQVSYSSGSSSSLTLSALYDTHAKRLPPSAGYRVASSGLLPAARPLKILLRPEDSGDRLAKTSR